MVIQVCYPVSRGRWDTKSSPTGIHRLFGHRVEGPADVPAGEKKWRTGVTSMFETVEVHNKRGVRAMTLSKAMLAGREGLVLLPEVDYFPYLYPDPDFTQDLQEHQRPETVQSDTIVRILGFRAEPSPL